MDLTDLSSIDQIHEAEPILSSSTEQLSNVESVPNKKKKEQSVYNKEGKESPENIESSMVSESEDASVNTENVGSEKSLAFLNLNPGAWKDLTREEIHQLIRKIPNHMTSRLLMRIARSLLLAPFEVPRQKENQEGDLNTVVLRAQKLYEMGFLADAYNLLGSYRALQAHTLYQKLKFEKDLMEHKMEDACTVPKLKLAKGVEILYWQKAQIACQVLQGRISEAQLSLNIFVEDQGNKEQDFISAVQLHLEPGLTQYTPNVKNPDSLGLILASKIPDGLMQDIVVKIPLLVRLYLQANLGNKLILDDSTKLDSYEEAVDLMLMETGVLKQSYLSYYKNYKQKHQGAEVNFNELTTNLTPEARAILYGSLLEQTMNEEESYKIILALVTNALQSNRLRPVLLLLGEKLNYLELKNETAYYVDMVVLSRAFAEEFGGICPWQIYVKGANQNQTLPFLFISCPNLENSYRNEQLLVWLKRFQAIYKDDLPAFHRYTAILFSIFEALGISVPQEIWQKIPTLPDKAIMDINLVDKALITKSAQNEKGAEIIARLLSALGETEEIWTYKSLLFILQKLRESGNKKLARLFAIELVSQLDFMRNVSGQ
jgi:hypothetical protein